MKTLVAFDQHGAVEIVDASLLSTVTAGTMDATFRANGACNNNGTCGTDVNTVCGVNSNGICPAAVNSNCGVNHDCNSFDVTLQVPV